MFISNSSQTNSFYHRIFLILRSPLRSFHSLSKIFQKVIEWFTRVNFLSHDINFNFFLSDRPITFSLILIFSTRSSSWSIFQFHDSIVSKEKKKKKYPFQRTKKGDLFQEESPIPNNSKSFLETWILLSPRKDHGQNSKVLPCPWPWLKRVTVHFYSRWPVRHVIRYKGSATKRERQAL